MMLYFFKLFTLFHAFEKHDKVSMPVLMGLLKNIMTCKLMRRNDLNFFWESTGLLYQYMI